MKPLLISWVKTLKPSYLHPIAVTVTQTSEITKAKEAVRNKPPILAY